MLAKIETKTPTGADIFRPLIEHYPDTLKAEADTWKDFISALGVTPECEMHGDESNCTIKECAQLRAFRKYVKAHADAHSCRQWHKRHKRLAAKDYLARLYVAARKNNPHRDRDLARIGKESERDYQLAGLYERALTFLNGKGPEPEVY